MCLIGLALDAHPRFGLVIAANRDEHFDRATAALDWWRPDDASPWLLGGRDLAAGGTWMGLSQAGRIGLLTNVRDPARHRAEAASRGGLVTAWLTDAAVPRAPHAVNPFNLIGGDLAHERWWCTSDRHAELTPLAPGVHALSNGALNEPWPKVRRLDAALRSALAAADDEHALAARLLAALDDRTFAADVELPDTGIGVERERALSGIFIHWPEHGYGTRCSTVLIGERQGAQGWRLLVVERSHDRAGRAAATRLVQLDGWPQRAERPPVQLKASVIS
jgi:uncharacterized protein with NRDE domain